MNTIEKTKIDNFSSLVTQGLNAWAKAGELLVEMIDIDGLSIPDISDQIPHLDARILSRFEQLGRKQVLPSLMVASYPAAKCVIRLSYSEQERLTRESLTVIVGGGKDSLQIRAENLTSYQCKQVFCGPAIRSLAAQRAWLESQAERHRIEHVEDLEMPYHISGKTVVFKQGCKLSSSQVAAILTQISK